MNTRIFQNWRSSLLGVALLIMSITLVCLQVISFTEFAFFFPTILGLLYVKDSIFRTGPERRQ